MLACLYVPNFHLQVATLRQLLLPGQAIALLEVAHGVPQSSEAKGAYVSELNNEAIQVGVAKGMTPSQARARCAAIEFVHRLPLEEQRIKEALIGIAHDFCPDVEVTRDGLITLDLMGVGRLAERKETIAEQLLHRATIMGLHAQVGMAMYPDLAALAACVARPIQIFSNHEDICRGLAPLPISVLNPPAEISEVLNLWGIKAIGTFTALPRHEVVNRFGPQGGELWDQGAGQKYRLLKLHRKAETFSLEYEPEEPVHALEPLMFLVRRTLETLCARLSQCWLVAQTMMVQLHLTNHTIRQRQLRVAEPCCNPDVLFRILHASLDGKQLEAPIQTFELELIPTKANTAQTQLFEKGLKDPNQFAETLARLEALLGNERVGSPRLLNAHRSDAFTMVPFLESAGQIRKTTGKTGVSEPERTLTGLPLKRFRPRLRAQVKRRGCQLLDLAANDEVKGNITTQHGPWLLNGEWWDTNNRWLRMEWDVELSNGALYRLVREEDRWYVEGGYA